MFERLDDTIVAVSSPPGRGVRGIVRLSGPEAPALAARVFACADGRCATEVSGHRRVPGDVQLEDDARVPGELYVFRGPASYTRQDVVEIHTLGAPAVLAILLDRLTDAGARPAEPGEFTARAFFAGALDLTRVEGVAAVIHARNDAQLRAAEALLHGGLSRRSTRLRERLVDLLALVEAEIDFVEESISFVAAEQVFATIDAVAAEIDGLLRDAPSVERLAALPEIVLVGRPNAGKSTLFNRLTGIERAIASATAGTTRDVLCAPLALPGGQAMLTDVAGLAPESVPPGDIAALAEEAARRAMATADVLVLVVDISDDPRATLDTLRPRLPREPDLVVAGKVDRLDVRTAATAVRSLETRTARPAPSHGHGGGKDEPVRTAAGQPSETVIAVSALTGEGIETLRARLARLALVQSESHGAETLALSIRQRTALREAADALHRARGAMDASAEINEVAELLAMELREAVHALSLLIGEVTTEDLLGRIFSSFCIGK